MAIIETAASPGWVEEPDLASPDALAGGAHRRRALAHLPAVAIGLLWFGVAAWIPVAEHTTYNSTSRDIGVYLQVLWSTAHGRPFLTTLLESNRVHLAEHLAPLLPALAPLYAAIPDARWLFVVQQAGLTLSAIPIYLLARRRLGGTWLPTLVVAAFFATPTLDEIAFDAFYPVTFAALPLAFAAYFLITRRWRAGVACALVALLVEEETGLTVLGLGLFLLLQRGARRSGLVLATVALVWLGAITLAAMPRFHEPSTMSAAADNRSVGHFDRLRQDPNGALTTLATERVPLAARWLVLPTGGLALLAPQVLLIDLPHAATLLLADKEGRYRRHWAAPLLPVIWLATVAALAGLRRPWPRALGVAALIAGSLASYVVDSSLPGGGEYEPQDVVWTERAEQLGYLVSKVPGEASVAASRRALGHLADRAEVYVYPPSYAGKLWPPERRVQTYVLDLTNDQTYEALAGRQSPLRASRPYAIWLAGSEAMLLIERPPTPTIAAGQDVAGLRLVGYDLAPSGEALELTLHWTASGRTARPLSRVVRRSDAGGAVLEERRGTVLDELFPTTEWPAGQLVVDRVLLTRGGRAGDRLEVGWQSAGAAAELVPLQLPSTIVPGAP